jgi:hypothetical protein
MAPEPRVLQLLATHSGLLHPLRLALALETTPRAELEGFPDAVRGAVLLVARDEPTVEAQLRAGATAEPSKAPGAVLGYVWAWGIRAGVQTASTVLAPKDFTPTRHPAWPLTVMHLARFIPNREQFMRVAREFVAHDVTDGTRAITDLNPQYALEEDAALPIFALAGVVDGIRTAQEVRKMQDSAARSIYTHFKSAKPENILAEAAEAARKLGPG